MQLMFLDRRKNAFRLVTLKFSKTSAAFNDLLKPKLLGIVQAVLGFKYFLKYFNIALLAFLNDFTVFAGVVEPFPPWKGIMWGLKHKFQVEMVE